MPVTPSLLHRIALLSAMFCGAVGFVPMSAAAIDIIPDIFKKAEITKEIWEEQEQYVALTPQGESGEAYPPNSHPMTTLDPADVRDALRSLELWTEGGFFRNEEAHPVFTLVQADVLGRYLTEALLKAKPNEDVIFNVRGYGAVALDTLKEREWTSGRAFFVDGRLNLIIGTFKLKKDRGMRNAEAAHGVLDNYADLHFDPGARDRKSKMKGRIVSSQGVALAGGDGGRNDWITIDVAAAALAFREGEIPEEQRKTAEKAKQEAAKLTLERRQMREEMARLRQQLKEIQGGGAATSRSLEDRLATLQELKSKNLISEEEYLRRRDEILKEI